VGRCVDNAADQWINGQGVFFYGYQFWLGCSLVEKRELDWAACWGLGGQRVFIVPERDLVVVVAGLYKSALQASVPLEILNQC
jgi:CubicO group peptidase (beta-lactamase class C family)